MTTIHANVPDYLAKLTTEAAEKERVSVDQLVSLALAAQVSAWKVRAEIETRAKRGRLEDFDRILARVPDVMPVPGDKLPMVKKRR
jgi:hypothetical protein